MFKFTLFTHNFQKAWKKRKIFYFSRKKRCKGGKKLKVIPGKSRLSSDISVYSKATTSQGIVIQHSSSEEESTKALRSSTIHDIETDQEEKYFDNFCKKQTINFVLLKQIVKKVGEYIVFKYDEDLFPGITTKCNNDTI